MRSGALILAMVLATGASALAQATQPAPASPTTSPTDAAIEQIRQAPNPSAAVEAYARAIAAPGAAGNLAIGQAYVRKMGDLGAPEMAEAQAQDLIKPDPSKARLAY